MGENTHKRGGYIVWFVLPTPYSENYIRDHINHSIDLAMNTNIDRIVICGDFNEDQLNPRKMQIKNICLQNNLVQIINNPTFYCETSSSLLDLVMINDLDIVIYSEIGENILDNSIRFHYPISGIINVEKCNNKTFKRKVWQYHRSNYELYTDILRNTDWDYLIDNTDLDTAVDDVYSIQHYVIKFVTGRWFSPGTPVSYTNITEILLKVTLKTIDQTKPIPRQRWS
jgi:hypothetical protein